MQTLEKYTEIEKEEDIDSNISQIKTYKAKREFTIKEIVVKMMKKNH